MKLWQLDAMVKSTFVTMTTAPSNVRRDGADSYLDQGQCSLVSRNGNQSSSFAFLVEGLGGALWTATVLLMKIVCLDRQG